MTERTLADDLRDENERLRRRFFHHTRPKGPMTMEEAMRLAAQLATPAETPPKDER